jgi:cell division protein FtsI/penicillin-binding protein 2
MALTGLIFRIFWLSIGSNATESKAVISRRTNEVVLYRTKGIIYDTNLIPIAGGQPCWYLVVNPREFKSEDLNSLAKLAGEEPDVVQKKLKKETPFVLKTQTEPVKLQGVNVFEGTSRYSGIATHLLGYLDSDGDVGLAGVEREYNDYLKLFSSKISVIYNADAVRGAIAGLGMKKQEKESSDNGVVLTLERDLCLQLDKSMDKHIETGAAVIMDCKTGAVKAVSSRPNYDANNISAYMESVNGELINRAFSAQTVGSVFKIIVAACA